jgi:hypothetical protein
MKRPNLPIIILVTALTAALIGATGAIILMSWSHQELPPSCTALPVRFVMQDPECAQKLLDAMNVSNVRIIRPNRFFTGPAACAIPNSCNGTTADRRVNPVAPDGGQSRS